MKFFIDTEFIEGFHRPIFGKRRHFIDLISIGIACEDGREYYAVSKEFKEKDADSWVKQNVLAKIALDLYKKESVYAKTYHHESLTLKNLVKWHGKSNAKIAQELLEFFGCGYEDGSWYAPKGIEVYGYYADYDWVLFCSLFGRMIDLPKGFPMYCQDLKQTVDERVYSKYINNPNKTVHTFDNALEWMKQDDRYPKLKNEHHALADAKWNHELYKFLQSF